MGAGELVQWVGLGLLGTDLPLEFLGTSTSWFFQLGEDQQEVARNLSGRCAGHKRKMRGIRAGGARESQ